MPFFGPNIAPIEKFSVGMKVSKWSIESIFMVYKRFRVNLESAEVFLEHFKNLFFSKNFAKFHNFVFLSSIDFGPNDFGRKISLNHAWALKIWAEVSVWSTLNAYFGPIDTAEMDKLLPHTFEPKLCSAEHFLMIFRCLQAFLNLMSGFRPKKCSNQKTFGGIKVSKW